MRRVSDEKRVLELTPGNEFTMKEEIYKGCHSGRYVQNLSRISATVIFRDSGRDFLVIWPRLGLGKLVTIHAPSSCGVEVSVTLEERVGQGSEHPMDGCR